MPMKYFSAISFQVQVTILCDHDNALDQKAELNLILLAKLN